MIVKQRYVSGFLSSIGKSYIRQYVLQGSLLKLIFKSSLFLFNIFCLIYIYISIRCINNLYARRSRIYYVKYMLNAYCICAGIKYNNDTFMKEAKSVKFNIREIKNR